MSAFGKIGPYDLYTVETGRFGLDGGAMFGVVPKPLWEKKIPPDWRNRIPLAARALLLVSGTRKILVDVGLGSNWDAKGRDIYAIDQTESDLLKSLHALGSRPEEITDVILTHLHFDHAGGSTFMDSETRTLRPTFSKATYHVQEANLLHARNPTLRDRASFRADDFEPLIEADQLKLYRTCEGFDHDEEILPHIQGLVCNGHTFGLQMIKIFDAARTVVYCADTFPTQAHLPAPWIMGYDLQPLVTLDEKLALLAKCRDQDWELFFEHDAKTPGGRVFFDEKGMPTLRIA